MKVTEFVHLCARVSAFVYHEPSVDRELLAAVVKYDCVGMATHHRLELKDLHDSILMIVLEENRVFGGSVG